MNLCSFMVLSIHQVPSRRLVELELYYKYGFKSFFGKIFIVFMYQPSISPLPYTQICKKQNRKHATFLTEELNSRRAVDGNILDIRGDKSFQAKHMCTDSLFELTPISGCLPATRNRKQSYL